MNNEVKVNLNITLQGRVMMSEQECSKIPQLKGYTPFSLKFTERKSNKKVRIGALLRKSKPATQSINITKESYDYMVSNECPHFSKPAGWLKMGKKKRLEMHLQRICESLNGESFTYVVFED